MENSIYILKLEEGKCFIHYSNFLSFSVGNIQDISNCKTLFSELEIYYDYLKKYKPIEIIEVLPSISYLDLDNYVKFYMSLFGIDNIRGGSYIEEHLSPDLEKLLNHELNSVVKYYEVSDIFSEILKKYEYLEYSLEEIDSEMYKINEEFQKFIFEKERLEKTKNFVSSGIKMDLSDFVPEDMNWLYDICILNMRNIETFATRKIEEKNNSNYVKKYRHILVFLKQIFNIFEEFDLFSKHSIEKTIFMKYPEFIFDPFIYHNYDGFSPTNSQTENLEKLSKTFLFMGNIVYNMIKEFEFDVASYGDGYEWKTSRILYILEKKRSM